MSSPSPFPRLADAEGSLIVIVVVFKKLKDVDVFSSLHSLSRLTVLTITVCDGRWRDKDPDIAEVSDFWARSNQRFDTRVA